ncbi:MAG TPA: DUF1707 domain-containing protein [Mycobacteriales bacterium]|nr:DUF1707 domain-containing protein [Mycobacteriales bacterium]
MATSDQSWGIASAIRIGDAERVAAATALGDHYAAGRLDQAELDERITAAYAARTQPELDTLFHDLPEPRPTPPAGARLRPAAPSRPAGWPRYAGHRRWSGHPARWPFGALAVPVPWLVPIVLVVAVVVTVLVLMAAATVLFLGWFLWLPLVWIAVSRRASGHHWHHRR